MYSSYYHTTT